MNENLPVLQLEEKHNYLVLCMQEYPHITDVFQNIFSGRPLNHNIRIKEMKTLDFYIESVFIPMLLKHEVIAKDESSPNKFKPLVSAIQTSLDTMNEKEFVQYVSNGMKDIADSVGPEDTTENLLSAFIHGDYPPEVCATLVQELREKAKSVLAIPAYTGKDKKKLKLALAVKAED